MPDIEKVIKGLECHAEVNCVECPYRDGWRTCPFGETLLADAISMLKEQEEEIENLKQTAQSMMEGICLLKEQEAKPVEVCGQMFTIKYGHCPKCGKGIDSEAYPQWCGFCGQAVKWK